MDERLSPLLVEKRQSSAGQSKSRYLKDAKIMVKKIVGVVVLLLAVGIVGSFLYVRQNPLAVFTKVERSTLAKAQFQKKQVSSSTGDLVYWEKGTGPALVFVHGAGDQAGTWSKVAPEFAKSYRVIIPDLAGHGESGPKSGPISIGDEVKGLEILFAELKVQKAILVGNSMGAWVSVLYAYQHPDSVDRLVLVNGGPYRINASYNLMPADREEARLVMSSLQDPGSPAIPNFVLDDIVRRSHAGPIGRLKQVSQEQFTLDGKLASMKTPADILWGQADKMLGIQYAEKLQAELAASRLTVLPRCGHIPQRECPITFTAKLAEVLQHAAPVAKPTLQTETPRAIKDSTAN
jgi:abhydrolase domain-containing protein 6